MVEVEPTVLNAENVRRRLGESGRAALADGSQPLAAGDRILVKVGGEQYDYHIRVLISRRNVTIDESATECECNSTELSEKVDAEITRAATLLSRVTDEPSTMANEPSTTADEPSTTADEPSTTKPLESVKKPGKPVLILGEKKPPAHASPEPIATMPKPMTAAREPRHIRIAGVATLIASSALLFVGAGMMGAGSTDLIDDWPHYERNWRPLGFTMGGVGLAGVAVGGSLILADVVRCRRHPDSCTPGSRYAKRHGSHRAKMGAMR